MNATTFNPQEYYASQGQISNPGHFATYLDALPVDVPLIVKAIQGLMLHLLWASRYGITLNRIREEEANLRTISDRLEKILELSDMPLSEPLNLSKKTVGTCRGFTLLLTSILRQRGIPARARAGFGTYFMDGTFEDHWVCEYWLAEEDRWVMVDPQFDELQMEVLKIDFDPLDMPKIKFVTDRRPGRCAEQSGWTRSGSASSRCEDLIS